MGIVIDARERFAERRRLAEQAREQAAKVDVPADKHQQALRELMEGDTD